MIVDFWTQLESLVTKVLDGRQRVKKKYNWISTKSWECNWIITFEFLECRATLFKAEETTRSRGFPKKPPRKLGGFSLPNFRPSAIFEIFFFITLEKKKKRKEEKTKKKRIVNFFLQNPYNFFFENFFKYRLSDLSKWTKWFT